MIRPRLTLVAPIVACLLLASAGCGNDDSGAPVGATVTPSATPNREGSPSPSPTVDPDLVVLQGPLVALNHHRDGHPRQIAIAADPSPETVWTTGGRELVYLWDGPLTRQMVEVVGSTVEVRGRIFVGFDFQRTIFPRSYALDDEVVMAPAIDHIGLDDSIAGTVVVLERYSDGHPRILGIHTENDGDVRLDDGNKALELRYRIGRAMRVRGRLDRRAVTMTVAAYEELEGSPLVRAGDGFRLTFLAGGTDAAGNFMGGVEIDTIESFDGKVFAGVSYRRNSDVDSNDPPPPGAQVLVLDRADGKWRVDFTDVAAAAEGAPRVVLLKRLSFATDAEGGPLQPAVQMLAAVGGDGEIYLRAAGESARWVATGLPERVRANTTAVGRRPDARSVVTYTDRVTGISHIFAGAFLSGRRGDGAGIYRGSYDPSLETLIRWDESAEFPFTATAEEPWRVMGLTAVEDAVYASLGKLLLRREDGPTPEWEVVFRDELPSGRDSLREAAAFDDASGGVSLLFGIEGNNSRVVRMKPAADQRALVEFLPLDLLGPALYGIIGYNGPALRRLAGGSALIMGMELLRVRGDIGLGIQDPDLGRIYEWTDGLILWRTPQGSYSLNRIFDRTLEVHPPLVGPRAILGQSPFPGEEEVVYVGGFDHNGHPFHNTAWIFKVHVDDLAAGLLNFPASES